MLIGDDQMVKYEGLRASLGTARGLEVVELPEGTIQNYVGVLLDKLEVKNRTRVAVLALRYGLVDPDDDRTAAEMK